MNKNATVALFTIVDNTTILHIINVYLTLLSPPAKHQPAVI